MSTLMSTDINLKRPTTRVHAPPGGAQTFSFTDKPVNILETSTSAAATNAGVTAPVVAPTTVTSDTPKKSSSCLVGIALAGTFAVDLLEANVVNAFSSCCATSCKIVVRHAENILSLPYVARSLIEECDAVFAGTVLQSEHPETLHIAASLSSTLYGLGLTHDKPIIPGIAVKSNMLEAKVVLPHLAQKWAATVYESLKLISDPTKFNKAVTLPTTTTTTTVSDASTSSSTSITITGASDNDLQDLLQSLRESLKQHGARGIYGLARKFRIADDDNSGNIDFSEFKKVISEHALTWNNDQIKVVFDCFDKSKDGSINFNEFLVGVRGELNERRTQLVLQAFQIMDADKNGVIEMSDITAKYNAKKHPDVIAGKRTEFEVLREFMDTFDSGNKDGKITPQEFKEYYSNVSASIDDDDYFELMIRNAWHISGGEGWCANSSNRRLLVTHADGRQTVEEIKNDLGIGPTDKDAMIANLKQQGITTVVSMDLFGSADNTTAATNSQIPAGLRSPSLKGAANNSSSVASAIRPSTVPSSNNNSSNSSNSSNVIPNKQGRYARGAGQTMSSSVTFG